MNRKTHNAEKRVLEDIEIALQKFRESLKETEELSQATLSKGLKYQQQLDGFRSTLKLLVQKQSRRLQSVENELTYAKKISDANHESLKEKRIEKVKNIFAVCLLFFILLIFTNRGTELLVRNELAAVVQSAHQERNKKCLVIPPDPD